MPTFGVISLCCCDQNVVSIQNEGARVIQITFCKSDEMPAKYCLSKGSHPKLKICRPLQGLIHKLVSGFLGLTPQAKNLPPLRGSSRIVIRTNAA